MFNFKKYIDSEEQANEKTKEIRKKITNDKEKIREIDFEEKDIFLEKEKEEGEEIKEKKPETTKKNQRETSLKEDDVFLKEKESLLDEVLKYFKTSKPKTLVNVNRGIISKEQILKEVETYLKQRKTKEFLIKEVQTMLLKYLWGYHILDDLIDNEDISDIRIMNENNIRIKRLGERMSSNVKFSSEKDLKRFINVVAIKNRVNISDINAVQTFMDIDTNDKFRLRFNISTEYVNDIDTPYLHVRKIPKVKYSKEKLIELGVFTRSQIDYLEDRLIKGNGIIFCGKGGSGKTTVMNLLLDMIPHNRSGLVIQENPELFSDTHPELMFQTVKANKGEGKINYSLKDLAINGLLLDLDHFVIGEIKGGEALYFLNASYTGHKVMASVHGNSSTEAMNKLVDYMKYESNYSREDLLQMVQNIDLVVYMEDFKISQISKILGYDEKIKNLKYETIKIE